MSDERKQKARQDQLDEAYGLVNSLGGHEAARKALARVRGETPNC